MNDFTASKFRVGNEIMACNHDPCNDICYDCEEKNRLIRIEAKLDRILAIIDKPKAVRKPKELQSESFERWWKNYPKKVGNKQKCLSIWNRKCLDSRVERLILDVNNRQLVDQAWQDKQFIPNPQTYLNGERWNDDIIPIKQAQIKIPRGDAEAIVFGIERGIEAKIGESMYDFRNRLEQAL
jgi:hypothetical protein